LRKVKIADSSIHLLVSQHLALLRLVLSPFQDLERISALLELNPVLGDVVSLSDGRWTSVGLEEVTRDLTSSISEQGVDLKKPNLVKLLAEKIPSSRAQISSLRLSPDDQPGCHVRRKVRSR
jgi:hypothetical protein